MSAPRRSGPRRWLLVAAGVAVILYGIVGFPTPNDPEPDAAHADRRRTCITHFWNAKLPKPRLPRPGA